MTTPLAIRFHDMDRADPTQAAGRIAAFAQPDGRVDGSFRRLGAPVRRALDRLVADPRWDKAKPGDGFEIAFPTGLAAEALVIVKLPRKPQEIGRAHV